MTSVLRARLAAVRRLFDLPVDDPELARSQLLALSVQIPLLYGILVINAVALAATHARSAPTMRTIVVPALLCVGCLIRLVQWRRFDVSRASGPQVLGRLRTTTRLTGLLGAVFTAWSMSLFPYGDAFAQCHVAFYMSITVITCIFCLMHLRPAALLLTLIVVVPFSVFFLLVGNAALTAITLNLVLVTSGLIVIMLRNYNDFVALIVSQRELVRRQFETQRLSDENLRLANIDSLTDLPNRRCFLAALDTAMAAARRDRTRFAVAMLDVDRFKGVNDVYGHGAGDRLLAEVGRRLGSLVHADLLFARLGGDEFGAILCGAASGADIAAFGQTIRTLLKQPCQIGENTVAISCSIGIAVYPDAGATPEQLFERADYALYHGKQAKTGDIVVFSDHHETVIRKAGRVEQALRNADLEREMWIAFQPIVDADSDRTVMFEALARWNSPDAGPVGPDVFIPIAERARLIGRLTETLLAKALRAAAAWPAGIGISFNLSAQDLIATGTMAAVRRITVTSGLAPGRIEFEITETAVLQDFDRAAAAIAMLHELGCRVALDDFGTGFSSLGHLHKLQLDKVKIDRSFLSDIDASTTSANIVRSIIDLCRNLDIACVVEGVETASQLRVLRSLGCRLFQGYLFGRPVPADAVAGLLAHEQVSERRHAAQAAS